MFGDKLRYLRKQRGLTMKELGQIFGLAESTIGMYETNKRVPEYDILVDSANYFQVPVQHRLDQGVYAKKDLIEKFMPLILKQMKTDIGSDTSLIELISKIDDFETQFKTLSAFLLDINVDEENKTIQLIYYV